MKLQLVPEKIPVGILIPLYLYLLYKHAPCLMSMISYIILYMLYIL